jgi:hypothetical protein
VMICSASRAARVVGELSAEHEIGLSVARPVSGQHAKAFEWPSPTDAFLGRNRLVMTPYQTSADPPDVRP